MFYFISTGYFVTAGGPPFGNHTFPSLHQPSPNVSISVWCEGVCTSLPC